MTNQKAQSQNDSNNIGKSSHSEEKKKTVKKNDEDSQSETYSEDEDGQGFHQKFSQVSVEEEKELIQKSKSKLEKLLMQPDIFDTLRRINNGEIKSFDELDRIQTQNQMQLQTANQSRRRGNAQKNDDLEELQTNEPFEILKIEQQPDNLVGGSLRDYQIEGLNWLYKLQQAKLNGILADEMGLGKTIQSISILALVESFKTEEERQRRRSHHIVIVPKIVLGKWKKEISDWVPSLRLFQFYGSNEERELQKQELRQQQFDIMLTTFEMIIREKHELQKYQFEFLILDEAQRIKNDESVLSQVLRKFKTHHRVLLTGTPLQNNLKELWSLLNFLMPKLFDSAEEFKDLFMIKGENEGAQEQIIRQIHRLLRPFMLRRLKVDVEKNLPTKKEIYLFFGLSKLQKQLYKNILTGNIDVVNGIGDKIKLLNVLMQLKKVCNHPYLFDKVEPGPPFVDGEHIIENSMKFKVLDSLIPKLLNQGCKILIFSQMTRLLDILDDFLRMRGFKYCRIDGQTSANDREIRIDEFQKPDSEKQLFILSTRAGGLGINLHSANVVIIFDSDWNPQVDLQAIDRAHRIGQKRDVVVYRFVTEGSVEEKIVEKAARKLRVDHLIMQKGKFGAGGNDNNPNKMNAQEMLSMIKYGAQEIILHEQEGQSMDANIDGIIERSMKKTEEINKELSKLEEKFNLNNVSLTGDDDKQTNLYTFEGQDYKGKRTIVQTNDHDFIDIGQRERKQMSYDIDKYYREALNLPTQTKEKKKHKGWKALNGGGYEHQFFENTKLDALDLKEQTWNAYMQNPEEFIKNSEDKQKPPQYTLKDQQYKERLLRQGFPNWTKKDFFQFIRLCETFGRENLVKIAEGFPAKSMDEIKDYAKTFWQKWESHIENGLKYVERIERGEAEIEKYKSIEQAIEDKFSYTFRRFLEANPEKVLKDFTLEDFFIMKSLKGPQSSSPFDFSEDEDKFISISLYKFGYGSWDLIRNDLRNNERFALNWVVRTRSAQDIQKRCDWLIQRFKKEVLFYKKEDEEKRLQKEEELRQQKKMQQQKEKQQLSKQSGKANGRSQGQSSKTGNAKQSLNGKRNATGRAGKSCKNEEDSDDLEESKELNSDIEEGDDSSQSDQESDGSEFNASTKKRARKSKVEEVQQLQNGNQNGSARVTRRSQAQPSAANNNVTPIKKREDKQLSKKESSDLKSSKKNGPPIDHTYSKQSQLLMEKLDEAIEKSKPSKEIVADKKTETKDGNVQNQVDQILQSDPVNQNRRTTRRSGAH